MLQALRDREIMLFVCLTALGLLLAGWGYNRFASAASSAQEADWALATCEKLAMQIDALREQPRVAAATPRQSEELIGVLEQARAAAGLSPESIARISPEPPRRIAGDEYDQRPFQVSLRAVSMQQAVRFLHNCLSEAPDLQVTALRLSGRAESGASSANPSPWNVELTLTQWVYNPSAKALRGRP